MSTSIVLSGLSNTEIMVADAAREQRDDILTQLRDVTAVTDAFDADVAAVALKLAKDFARGMEESRTEVKKPVLELTRKIDALAKEITADVITEADRISKLLGSYQAEERRKQEAAERLARDEERRIRDEAARKMQEANRNAATEADAQQHVAAIQDMAAERIVQTRASVMATVAPKASGTAVRENVCFEVVDIVSLYAARPELVTLEPNGTAIRAICKSNPSIKLPGLNHWLEAKTFIR